MQASTTSPSAAIHSTDFDSVASQHNIALQTAANTYTQNCGRRGCPAVFEYKVGAGWPTVSRIIREHTAVCTGGSYELDPSYVLYHTHNAQNASSPLQPVPESWGLNNGSRDEEVIALSIKQRQTEDERRAGLEGDVYTADVQPTSVRCRGCQKVIKLDRRSRYYSGLWTKHRGKCPGILKIESNKLTSGGDCYSPSNPERHPPAASSFGASGGGSNGDGVVPSSTSDVRFYDNRWAWRVR
ncbi:hypothetical protein EDB19DRAFT_547906 [Suillus lakei]|nr:hypothetical protein EDB19DRAFT_547906 [Suillus lakei]